MNAKETYAWERKWLGKFDRTILVRHGSLNEIGTRGYLHERIAFEVVRAIRTGVCIDIHGLAIYDDRLLANIYLTFNKEKVYTEMWSEDKKQKADIVVCTYPSWTIIELADSESNASLDKKRYCWEGKGFVFMVIRI